LESKGLKPVSHFKGSRVETRRFQSMGPSEFNLYSPTVKPALAVASPGSEDEADEVSEEVATGELRTPPTTSVHPSTTAAAVACCEECSLERWGLSHEIAVQVGPFEKAKFWKPGDHFIGS
jgi:hypothetical protein